MALAPSHHCCQLPQWEPGRSPSPEHGTLVDRVTTLKDVHGNDARPFSLDALAAAEAFERVCRPPFTASFRLATTLSWSLTPEPQRMSLHGTEGRSRVTTPTSVVGGYKRHRRSCPKCLS